MQGDRNECVINSDIHKLEIDRKFEHFCHSIQNIIMNSSVKVKLLNSVFLNEKNVFKNVPKNDTCDFCLNKPLYATRLCENLIFAYDHEYDIKNDIVCSTITEINNIIVFIKKVFNNRHCYLAPCATFYFHTINNGLRGINILKVILSLICGVLTYGMFDFCFFCFYLISTVLDT